MKQIADLNLRVGDRKQRLDWNSLNLLCTLSLPALFMAVILFLWPDVRWQVETLHTAVVLVGSLAAVMLSIFLVIRYRGKPGIEFLSAGLLSSGLLGGFQSVTQAGSPLYIWLYVSSGLFSGICFIAYLVKQQKRNADGRPGSKTSGLIIVCTACLAVLFGILSLAMNSTLTVMFEERGLLRLAWIMNAIPLPIYLISAVYIFSRYRKTGNGELFLFTALSLFLFQTCEVFYFAKLWSVVWWFWLTLRLIVYISVFIYLLKEYVRASDSLAVEILRRRSIEGELRQAENDWRSSFDSLEDAMLIIDSEYNILNFNDSAKRFHNIHSRLSALPKCFYLFGEKNRCKQCPFQTTLATGRVSHIRRDYNGRNYSVKAAPITGKNGAIDKFVYLISDITEQNLSEEKEKLLQLELSHRSRLASIGEVVAGVTHEINNPLTSVIAFAQLLQRSNVPENIKEAIEVINEGTTRVAEIVDKLHTFSRRQRPEKEFAQINSIIAGVLQIRSYELKKHNVEIIANLSDDIPKIMVNVGQLQQVLLNIIVNAEQAMDQTLINRTLMVNSSLENDLIRISISDNGPGINEENMEKLFTPFFTTKDVNGGPGLGLGLSISYGIIKEHGGRIYAKSCLGNGATFTIELPVLNGTEAAREDIDSPPEKESSRQSRILVIDDEIHIRRAIERVLSGEGHEVQSTPSARSALDIVKLKDFDLLMLDIKMPGIDGIYFFEQLIALKPDYRGKVICMTGDLVSSRNKDFIRKEGIPYLIKPFGIDELLQRVKSIIGRKNICVNSGS